MRVHEPVLDTPRAPREESLGLLSQTGAQEGEARPLAGRLWLWMGTDKNAQMTLVDEWLGNKVQSCCCLADVLPWFVADIFKQHS